MLRIQILEEFLLESGDFLYRYIQQESLSDCVDDDYLILYRHGLVLRLLQHFFDPFALCQLLLGIRIQFGSELCEGSQLSVLGKLGTDRCCDLLHSLDLCGTTYTGYGQTCIYRRTETGVEHFCLQIDLSIGNGNNVGRDVCRYIACLGLDDGKCRQGTSAVFIAHADCTLQQSGMQVEYVTGICFTSGRTTKEQGECTVCSSMFAQVIIYHQYVFSVLHPLLTDRTTGIRSDIL